MADDAVEEAPGPEPISFTINGTIPADMIAAMADWSVVEPAHSWKFALAQAVLDQVGYEPSIGHQIQVRFIDDADAPDLWLPRSDANGGWAVMYRSSDGQSLVVKDTDTGDIELFKGQMMFRPDRELRRSRALNAAIEAGVPFI
jgi:hypothetical protein